MSDETKNEWQVGDRVIYVPKYSFDSQYHRGTIVNIEEVPQADGSIQTSYLVQAETEFGFGQMRLARTALQGRW